MSRMCDRGVVVVLIILSATAWWLSPAGSVPSPVHGHEVSGVDVMLLGVQRTGDNTVTVRWNYVNKTAERKKLTAERTGWIDPYRLSVGAYLLDGKHMVKYPVLRDSKNVPIAATHGGVNQWIYIQPHQTLSTWAKFGAPPVDVEKVTVAIPGADPFEDVPITQ
jgi:hypothetical protein